MNTTYPKSAAIAILVGSLAQAGPLNAQENLVLDSRQHPVSPPYQSIFPNEILPLDTKLSWTKRFNGNETFSDTEVLRHNGKPYGVSDKEMKMEKHAEDSHAMQLDGTGVIKQVKKGQAKIKIEHGPIDRLGMPAMTMVFKVLDPTKLESLEKGQEVGFSVDNTAAGFVVTEIMPASAGELDVSSVGQNNPVGQMDGLGTVKTIRASQGKIKIEHGPIESLGMPAMTMVFKVEDPAQLDGIEKGGEVEFSVENSSGGFVITHIRPMK